MGHPALELGCGDGDRLLDLIERGLDVEGLDASADMLDRCRARAAGRGLDVTLHHAAIEAMELGRRYQSMFLAGPTFNLLPDDATALMALERMGTHLEPGGAALVPLFTPPEDAVGTVGVTKETQVDGATMWVIPTAVRRDEDERRQTTVLRYELQSDEETTMLEREWALHWHTQDGFRALAARSGLSVSAVLDHDAQPAPPDATDVAFWLTRQ